MSAKVVEIPAAARPAPQLPPYFPWLRPMHALLFAMEAYGSAQRAIDVCLRAGFKDKAIAMAWRNAWANHHIDYITVRSISPGAEGEQFDQVLTEKGTQALAALNKQAQANPPTPPPPTSTPLDKLWGDP